MCDIQGSGTHLQKMMVVNDKDNNMITVLMDTWAVAIYTYSSKQTRQYEILGQHARHACTGVKYTYKQLG